MKIYLAPSSKMLCMSDRSIRELINLADVQRHELTDHPDEANIILIIDTAFVYHHHRYLLNQYLEKCYALEDTDCPYLVVPGLYACAPGFFLHQHFLRGCCYYSHRPFRSPLLKPSANESEKKYLFSFMGGSTCLLRKRLFNINFQRSDVFVQSTVDYAHWTIEQPNRIEMQRRYVESLESSKFVLCPRGSGLGSIRLYEVMEMGIAPVIISDGWLPPSGPDWNRFAIFVKQSDLKRLPEILERYAPEYQTRGRLAREAWEQYFADPVAFNRFIESIEELSKNRIPLLDRFVLFCCPLTRLINGIIELTRSAARTIVLSFFRFFKLKLPFVMRQA